MLALLSMGQQTCGLKTMQGSSPGPLGRTREFALAGSAIFAGVLAILAYRGAVTSDFTGADTVALIEESRIRSLDDFARVMSQPMLPITTKFYRPTAALSYALDDALWGFDAVASHAMDIAIHGLAAAMLVLVVARFSRSTLAAAAAGFVFALHPVLMETVPTATRRQDTLAGLFMLLALLWLPWGDNAGRRAVAWVGSLGAALLAFGSKEGSVILPALVFLIAALLPTHLARGPSRWRSALRLALPFAVLAVGFVALRSWVLGGAGGNARSWNWTLASIPKLGENSANFFADLCYPLRVIFHPYLGSMDRWIAIAFALGFIALIPAMLRAWDPATWNPARAKPSRILPRLLLLALCSVLLFPIVSPWIRDAIEQAYRGEGWNFLVQQLASARRPPAEFYVARAFEILWLGATSVLILLGAVVAWAAWRARPRTESACYETRLMEFSGLWIALHLCLFLAVQRYHAWNAYLPAIPFCIFVGLLFARGLRGQRWLAWVSGGFALWVASQSALVRGLETWTENGKFNTLMMTELARVAAEAPAGTTLRFHDMPSMNLTWQKQGPAPVSVYTINTASTQAWLRRVAPDKGLKFELIGSRPVQWPVAEIRMEIEPAVDGRAVVRTRVTAGEVTGR